MGTELELKLRIIDPAPLQRRLRELGARPLHRHLEINTFLDTPAGDLRRGESGLRVRLARDLDSGQSRVVLTFKGPRQPSAFKLRPEVEMLAESYDDAVAFLGQLGFAVTLSFEKRRDSWQLGDCEIELDELPQLGRFLEIEGPSEPAIENVQRQLGLEQVPHVQEGYAVLVARHLDTSSAAERVLRFG